MSQELNGYHRCDAPAWPVVERRRGRMISMTDSEYERLLEAVAASGAKGVNSFIREVAGVLPRNEAECNKMYCADPEGYEKEMERRHLQRLREECTTASGSLDEELFEFLAKYPRGTRPSGKQMRYFKRRLRKTPAPV